MKRFLQVLSIIFIFVMFASCDKKVKNTTKYDLTSYIDNLIESTDSYIPSWNKEGFKGRWNYIDGVFLNSIVSLYYENKDTNEAKANEYKSFLIKYVNYYINENGKFINPETNELGYRRGELDSVCESRILFDLYEMTNDERYLTAIEYTYKALMTQSRISDSYNFSHKESYYGQIWLDGMYMYAPFYVRYAQFKNDTNIFHEVRLQYEYIRNHQFDSNSGLYYHGYDSLKSIFWADSETGCSESFWLRSMGWYIVSLTDILEYYPECEDKTYLNGLLKEAVDGILKYQDADSKMFYQVIDKGPIEVFVDGFYISSLNNTNYDFSGDTISNYLESSGSSMIAYSILKASRLGYLDSSYKIKGEEIYEGIYNHSFDGNNLNDICITAGLGPSTNLHRDGSIEYYLAEPVGSNDAKGVGPFIMAFIEYSNTSK